MRGVPISDDIERVDALPRRDLAELMTPEAVSLLTKHLAKEHNKGSLFPIQAAALYDLHEAITKGNRGIEIPIGVGGGKSLVCCLAGAVLPKPLTQYQRLVWLVPANLRVQCTAVAAKAKQDWKIDYQIHVVSYEDLSSPRKLDLLDKLCPSVIACDEAHKLQMGSVRTKRFRRYIIERAKRQDGPVVLFGSGTLLRRSLFDLEWLFRYTHPLNSPLPLTYTALRDWDRALGSNKHEAPLAPGALMRFANKGETAREGFGRRLANTLGVVTSKEITCPVALNISMVKDIVVPDEIQRALEDLHRFNRTPYGEVFDDPLTENRYAQQIALGYWLRWIWPGGIVDAEWLRVRAAWHTELRDLLKRAPHGRDSAMLMTNAVIRGEVKASFYEDWCKVKDRYAATGGTPPSEAVWVSDYAVKECLKVREGAIWYSGRPFGDALRATGKIPVYMAGDDELIMQSKAPVFAASIRSHGTGKNLQAWSTAVCVSPPASGDTMEQLIGRHHRVGTTADEINFSFWNFTEAQKNAVKSAREQAQMMHEMQNPQRLVLATYV